MMQLVYFVLNVISLIAKFCRPGGLRSIAAENMLLKQQLITIQRRRKKAPKLNLYERARYGLLSGLVPYKRLIKSAVIIKPATILKFHQALVKRKYSALFSKKSPIKPGPKGPEAEVIKAIVSMKQKNPRYGCLRIAMQESNAFGIDMNKDVVRRVLAKHYKSNGNGDGPSWLSFLADAKDSLWSMDFFRVESIHLQSYWIMLVMDQFTRTITGLAVNRGDIAGSDLCRMFHSIISQKQLPKLLSTDNAALFNFHRWQANLRILEIEPIQSVPYTPISHPYIERLIQTVRHEYLDHVLFWNERDLTKKLQSFAHYYNHYRGHFGLDGKTPSQISGDHQDNVISINDYQWKKLCNRVFELPVAA